MTKLTNMDDLMEKLFPRYEIKGLYSPLFSFSDITREQTELEKQLSELDIRYEIKEELEKKKEDVTEEDIQLAIKESKRQDQEDQERLKKQHNEVKRIIKEGIIITEKEGVVSLNTGVSIDDEYEDTIVSSKTRDDLNHESLFSSRFLNFYFEGIDCDELFTEEKIAIYNWMIEKITNFRDKEREEQLITKLAGLGEQQ